MTTSFELSKKLWDLGLKIGTEKHWWKLSDGNWVEGIGIGLDDGIQSLPRYSTDELLAILFSTGISRIGLSANSAWDDSAAQIIPKCFYGEISEALGLMCEWLLDNGWRWSNTNKLLVKGEEK